MATLATRLAHWALVVSALSITAGCPRQLDSLIPGTAGSGQSGQNSPAPTPNSNILHALPSELDMLLYAPPIEPPVVGAAGLANTRWKGTQDCVITGDVNVLLSGPGTRPMSESLYFDEQGISSQFDALGNQYKRAVFTDNSFDVATTFVISTSTSGVSSTSAYVTTMTGQRSADGRTLTGRTRIGMLIAVDGTAADVAVVQDCTFTLDLVD